MESEDKCKKIMGLFDEFHREIRANSRPLDGPAKEVYGQVARDIGAYFPGAPRECYVSDSFEEGVQGRAMIGEDGGRYPLVSGEVVRNFEAYAHCLDNVVGKRVQNRLVEIMAHEVGHGIFLEKIQPLLEIQRPDEPYIDGIRNVDEPFAYWFGKFIAGDPKPQITLEKFEAYPDLDPDKCFSAYQTLRTQFGKKAGTKGHKICPQNVAQCLGGFI